MPLLNKVPFERQVIRQNLKDDEKVFYCSVTDEIFENYEEFCDRVLLVNSVIWTCAYTGKTHMTFEEAAASEEHSRGLLKDFPVELRIPALYLASLTQRTSLENLAEDVFSFAKERYFVGESVEVNFKGDIWCESHVIQVMEPAKKENNAEDNSSGSRFSGCLPASVFRYEVDSYEQDDNVEHVVTATHIRRKKGVFNRDRNRLYLKQFAEPEASGIWRIKSEALQKYGIPRVKFENIFVGRHPVFQASKNIRKPQAGKSKQKQTVVNGKQTSQNNKKEKRQESIEKYLTVSTNHNNKKTPTKADGGGKKAGAAAAATPQKQVAQKVKEKYRNTGGVTKKKSTNHMVMSVEKLKLLREQQKEHAREVRRKRGIERGIERAKVKEEKRRLDEFMKRWNQPREDLECEDLKLLPTPVPVQSRIPNEHFGDFLMILEFFHNFSEALSMKESFPHGITFDLVERALSEQEVAGPFSDIMQFLLMTLFNMQEEEDDEVSSDATQVADLVINERTDVTTSEAIRLATAAASWSQQYQGTPMNKLPLDAVTLTEVLRLHLLSSGGRCGDVNAKWRYQQRGGYTSRDDPGLLLRMQSPHILRALGVMSIFDLPLGDKLTIIACLINQILTYAAFRDVVDERCETYRVQRIELKVQQLSVIKKEKELAVLKIKQRKDAKVKPKGEAAAAGAEAGALKSPPPLEDAETEAQLAERIAKLEKEMARSQADYQRKASQLKTVAVGHRVVPLGTDRAHRRFWTFNSCPGLFVEHDPVEVGPCLPAATPHDPTLECTKDTILYVRRLFEEEQSSGGNNGGSDKENDSHDDKKRTPKKPTAVAAVKTEAGGTANAADAAALLMICTADERCIVHGDAPKTRWAFYSREDDVNALVEGLSTRGVREAELRQSLVDEHQKIVQALPRCPAHKLNTVLETEGAFTEDRKSVRGSYTARYNEANLNFPPGTPADEIFELSLRDMILDLEEKSHCGGLGTLKVYNREAWRNAISARSYDKQCSQLQFGIQNPIESPENIPIMKTSGRTSGRGSRSGTPTIDAEAPRKKPKVESIEYKDPGRLLGAPEMKHNPVVTDLASAILQVGQSLEKKYRQKPLVFKGDDWSQIERWELSLMASTNLSQLFIHYYTLESSIQWSKSALNANCRLCRRRGDPENMLLCDNCNKGHHLYCLKPKLTKVPTGDWFCPKCRPQVKTPRAERKRRSIFVPEEDEVEEEVEADESLTEEEAEEAEEAEPPFYEVCDTCGEGGEVICCDTESCILVYHIECLVPPLKKVPRGKWYCPKCKAVPPPTAQARASKDGDGEWQPKEQSPPVNRNRRGCAAAAVAKISKFAKQIRSRSWENNDSDGGHDAHSDELQPSRRSARMSLEPDLDLPLNNALLQDLLTEVMHHKDAWPFLRPVVRAQVPDYHLIIKRPMDLGTMKNKLNMLNYTNNSEFIADANLVFENCKMYNQYDAQEYKCGIRLRKLFEKRCKELGLHTAFEEDEDDEEPPKKKSRNDDK